jgi:hypothetical protein
METPPPHSQQAADSLVMRQQLERISEPWFMNKVVAVGGALVMAMVLGSLAASGQFEMLVLVAVWVVAVLIIVFVRDYWWSPAIVVTTLGITTYAAGFLLTGLEVGMVFIGLTFPVKLAMKTLWPAKPKMDPGLFYWALVGFVVVHAVVIYFYSKIGAEPGIKNIIKAYYGAIAPLVLYGMLMRYCNSKTVFPTVVLLFGIWIVTTIIALFVLVLGVEAPPLTGLKIHIDFIDGMSSTGFLRGTGPALFIFSIAFWPVERLKRYRLLLAFAGVLGIVATLYGAGRTHILLCIFGGLFFALVRKRLWLTVPVILAVALLAGFCTLLPELQFSLPLQIQRTLAPLNFSDDKTQVQAETTDSDRYHSDLREDSLVYWMYDTTSFWVGHGFKGWDESLNDPSAGDYETWKSTAIQMGLTENMFSAITNIFGLTGLILYGGFLIQLTWRSWKGRRVSPERSVERALCEFSFVFLVNDIVLAPLLGSVPGIILVFWSLGVLAARPYLGEAEPVKAAVPAFDRSRQVLPVRRAGSRGDPLAEFRKRQPGFRFARKGPAVP